VDVFNGNLKSIEEACFKTSNFCNEVHSKILINNSIRGCNQLQPAGLDRSRGLSPRCQKTKNSRVLIFGMVPKCVKDELYKFSKGCFMIFMYQFHHHYQSSCLHFQLALAVKSRQALLAIIGVV